MDIISTSTKIKEKDKTDGKLTDEFKFTESANFAKLILDFIKEGNVIRIKSFTCEEKEDNYICSAVIVIKKITNKKGKLISVTDINNKVVLKNNKIILEKQLPKVKYDVIGDEKDVMM